MFLRCLPKGPKTSGICHEFVKNRRTENGPKRDLWHLCNHSPHTQSLPQPSLMSQKAREWNSPGAHLPLAAAHLFVCLHTWCWVMLQVWLFCYFCGFYYSSSKKQQLKESGSSNANSKGKAEELRSPAFSRISKLAFCSILMSLVFSQIALILDI